MKPKLALWASVLGTVMIALCCFTPVLVVTLSAIGLGAVVGCLDCVLLPALLVMLIITFSSYRRYRQQRKFKMNKCCSPSLLKEETTSRWQRICPKDGTKGKPVELITLKSLLIPAALEQLDAMSAYGFCQSPDCLVVYFSEQGNTFSINDLKVPIFQKDSSETAPVCYCFGWSRQRISEEIRQLGESSAISSITAHIKMKRCGCEVNNPQGSCCLGNVRTAIEQSTE